MRRLAQGPLQFRRNDKPSPAHEKAKTAQRCDGAEPADIRQRHRVQTSAEKKDAGQEQPPGAAIGRAVKRDHEERDRVNEMIKHGLVPDIKHTVAFDRRS